MTQNKIVVGNSLLLDCCSRLMKFDSVGINKNCVNGKKNKEKLIIIKRNKEGVMDYEKLR